MLKLQGALTLLKIELLEELVSSSFFYTFWAKEQPCACLNATDIKIQQIHRKKRVREFPVPSRDVTTKLSLGGNNDAITELFLPGGSLVSDIPAGDGKLVNFIYGIQYVFLLQHNDLCRGNTD
jgi:hypothetical protein